MVRVIVSDLVLSIITEMYQLKTDEAKTSLVRSY